MWIKNLHGSGAASATTLVEGELLPWATGWDLCSDRYKNSVGRSRELELDDKDHVKYFCDRITDTSGQVNTVRRDMGDGCE